MNNLEKYNHAFLSALSITPDKLSDNLCYQDIEE